MAARSVLERGAPSPRRNGYERAVADAEVRELFCRAQNGDRSAHDALIERFMPLARSLARRYRRSSEPFDDLIQVANLGLLKAVQRFDPERGVTFSTYAVPTILGELKRHFRDTGWAVHVPRALHERSLLVEHAERTLETRLARSPTVAEIAEELGLSLDGVLEAMEAASAYEAVSMDARVQGADGEHEGLVELLGRDDPHLELVEERATVAATIRHLPARDRAVLQLRFGEDMTQSEIAKRIGVSQMQVSRIIRRAVARLTELAEAG